MKTNNTLRTAILTALVATATGAQALPAETTTLAMSGTPEVNQKADTVYLMVKRESLKAEGWPWERVEVKASEAEAAIKKLLEDPDVLEVEMDEKVSTPTAMNRNQKTNAQSVSIKYPDFYNDPSFINQPIFHSTSGHSMRLIEGLMRAKTQEAVRVAVLDTGFTPSNDVIYSDGYSFSDPVGPEFRNGMGGICSNLQNPDLEKLHGIGVASVAAAKPNNGIAMAGVSPNIELVAGRVGMCEGSAFISEITEGLLWAGGFATQTGAPQIEPVDVVNISFGGSGSCPSYLQSAIDMVTERGVTVVIAAGNEGGNTADHDLPSCTNTVVVAATTHDGQLADFSNTGANVDIAATGAAIRTLTANDEVTYSWGTSFAAPLVAGTLAVVKGERPNMTPAEFNQALRFSGNPLTVETAHYGIGGGVLDLMKLMDEAGIPRAQVPVNHALSGERERFAAALLHPKAAQYVADNGTVSTNLCLLTEVDGRALNPMDKNTPISLFRVAKGSPLTPADPSASIIDQLDAGQNRGIIAMTANLDTAAYDYGIAQCDTETGLGCNQKDTIRAVDPASLATPAFCESQILAAR